MSVNFDINKITTQTKEFFPLLYTKWSVCDVLYPLEKKEIINFDKSKIPK